MNGGDDRKTPAASLLPSGETGPSQLADEGFAGDTATPRPVLRATFSPERRRIAPLAIGVGFRTRCTAGGLAALVGEALSHLASERPDLAQTPAILATVAEKDRPPLRDAATLLGLPVVLLSKSALVGTEDRITVASDRVRACHGIPSVAEAAALAAAGPGSRLVLRRIATADATCAIALRGDP